MSDDTTAKSMFEKFMSQDALAIIIILAMVILLIIVGMAIENMRCDTSCKLEKFNIAVIKSIAQDIYTADECKDIALQITGGE